MPVLSIDGHPIAALDNETAEMLIMLSRERQGALSRPLEITYYQPAKTADYLLAHDRLSLRTTIFSAETSIALRFTEKTEAIVRV